MKQLVLRPDARSTAFLIALILTGVPAVAARADGPMRGPLPAEQRDLIHDMAEHHDAFTRTVDLTETGYSARTVSEDPEVVAKLQAHIAYMQARMDSGAMVRRWDPAFEEMFRYHADIAVYVMRIRNGVEVRVEGSTPDAILVAQNHAKIISGFVDVGMEAVQATHAAAMDAGVDGGAKADAEPRVEAEAEGPGD